MASSIWELLCAEHCIRPDGQYGLPEEVQRNFETFFLESSAGLYVPRAVICDLEPTVVDEIRNGHYRDLFHPSNLVTGLEDASNNYAAGRHKFPQMVSVTLNRIRKAVENCDYLSGFMLFHSMGGGTGSGFVSMLTEKVCNFFGKTTKLQMSIYPGGPLSTCTVEPYNTVLGAVTAIEHMEISLALDNYSLYNICQSKVNVPRPSYIHVNRVLSQVFNSMTSSLRYHNSLTMDLSQMQTNIVPFPRLHFPSCAYAPLFTELTAQHVDITEWEITRDVLHPDSLMAALDLDSGRYMAVCLQYRGLVSPQRVCDAINLHKKHTKSKFVDWCPTGFKVGICTQPTLSMPGSGITQSDLSVSCLINHTSCANVFDIIMKKFKILFSKRSFLYWYISEGMEEGEFQEASEEVQRLLKDYQSANEDSKKGDDEEEEPDFNPSPSPDFNSSPEPDTFDEPSEARKTDAEAEGPAAGNESEPEEKPESPAEEPEAAPEPSAAAEEATTDTTEPAEEPAEESAAEPAAEPAEEPAAEPAEDYAEE